MAATIVVLFQLLCLSADLMMTTSATLRRMINSSMLRLKRYLVAATGRFLTSRCRARRHNFKSGAEALGLLVGNATSDFQAHMPAFFVTHGMVVTGGGTLTNYGTVMRGLFLPARILCDVSAFKYLPALRIANLMREQGRCRCLA